MKIKALALVVATVLTGCSLAPQYEQPKAPEISGWQGIDAIAAKESSSVPEWRSFMADSRLQSLVEKALLNNKDLRQSILNVESLRAAYNIQDAASLPSISADASGTRQRTSAAYNGTGKAYSSQYSATLGVTSYELDLFGRVKNLSNQALESYLAQDETRRSAVLSLISEVASAYMTLLADQQLLSLTQETVNTYQETFELVKTRYDAGYSSALTLAQSRTVLYGAQASLAQYKLSVAKEYNVLRQLVGAPIDQEIDGVLPSEGGQMLSDLAVGAPSSLLQSRPDILAAEHMLKAANANIGAARAAFYPNISLTAAGGSMSSSLDDLFSSNSGYWRFSPSLSLPIFDWGGNQATLDKAKIAKELTVVQYQQAIETGFKEVSDALLGQQYYMEEWSAQQSNLDANKEYYELALMRYEKGNDSYMDLLDAQRSLFSARESELTAHLNLLVSRVTLYKALGGGWQAADLDSVKPRTVEQIEK
jgi:outer membrane protein, multidrug efflux system